MSDSPEIMPVMLMRIMKVGLTIRRSWQATGRSRGAERSHWPIRALSLVEIVGTSHVAPHRGATNCVFPINRCEPQWRSVNTCHTCITVCIKYHMVICDLYSHLTSLCSMKKQSFHFECYIDINCYWYDLVTGSTSIPIFPVLKDTKKSNLTIIGR